jgi:hypothetical protein
MNRNVERTENRCGVRDFAQAMQDKLDRKIGEGRGGWWDPKQCSIESLCIMLADHIKKGDMVDIGNFAMMIWNRQRTAK